MKTLFLNCSLIIILLVSCSSPMNSTEIIGTPIKIENLEVAQNDFPDAMEWESAVKACEKLGSGWRLPTKDELDLMYSRRWYIGGFGNTSYFSSSEDGSSDIWLQDFKFGFKYSSGKYNYCFCRAVRSF